MDKHVAKYLNMLEHNDPEKRIVGLDCFFTYDPLSALLEEALKTTAILDDSVEVRKKAIEIFMELYETTSNKAACEFLTQIVDNKEGHDSCRRKAYFAMKMICFTPPHLIAIKEESADKQLESLFAKVKEVADMKKIYSKSFDVDRDVDWQFVERFRRKQA